MRCHRSEKLQLLNLERCKSVSIVLITCCKIILAAKICFDGVENGPSKIWVTNTLQQTLDRLPLLPGQIKIYDDVTVQLLGDRVETNLLSHAAVHQ